MTHIENSAREKFNKGEENLQKVEGTLEAEEEQIHLPQKHLHLFSNSQLDKEAMKKLKDRQNFHSALNMNLENSGKTF
jgi:hypothetical protein